MWSPHAPATQILGSVSSQPMPAPYRSRTTPGTAPSRCWCCNSFPARAVAEMRRVVRPGGTVTAAVWDAYGGMPPNRMIWDTAAALDQSVVPPLFRPLSQPNEMATLWRELGLLDVEQTSLLIRMEFSGFDDFWLPL